MRLLPKRLQIISRDLCVKKYLYKMLLYFVLTFCIMYYVKCEEPNSCSQFHYVDKLLDKMIRMEIRVENLNKEITEKSSHVHSTLVEIKHEREEFRSERTKTNADIQSKIQEHKKDFQELKKQIKVEYEHIKEKAIAPNVVFKARSPIDISLETGQTIIFTENMLNYGDGYDNTTGIFTAPVSGTYLFTFHLCVYNQQSMYYGLVYNDIIHTSGLFYDYYNHVCHTADGMLPLDAGHKVWIKCLSGSPSSNVLYETTTSTYNEWNTFSGMLIHT